MLWILYKKVIVNIIAFNETSQIWFPVLIDSIRIYILLCKLPQQYHVLLYILFDGVWGYHAVRAVWGYHAVRVVSSKKVNSIKQENAKSPQQEIENIINNEFNHNKRMIFSHFL